MSSGFVTITPDGALCCICLERFAKADLHVEPNGTIVDVCKSCGEKL